MSGLSAGLFVVGCIAACVAFVLVGVGATDRDERMARAALMFVLALFAMAGLTACAPYAPDDEPDTISIIGERAAPDAAPTCLPAYVNDSGIEVGPRCATSSLRCVEDECVPCGLAGQPCCASGTWLSCDGFSCVAGTCR